MMGSPGGTRLGSAIAAIALLAACGGGGSGSSSGAPTASPAPTPSPTPTPSSASGGFSIAGSSFALGQATPVTYAVYAFSQAARDNEWGYDGDPASLDFALPVGMRLAGPAHLRLSIGNLGEDTIVPNGGGGISGGQIQSLSYDALGGAGSLSLAYGPAVRPLTSVANGSWIRFAREAAAYPYDIVGYIYGVPTMPADVPVTGSFEYRSCCDQSFISVTADFATGRLTGSIPLDDKSVLELKDVTFGADRTTFAGQVLVPGGGEGTIEGRFAGAGAGELMARVIYPIAGGRSAMLLGATRTFGS